MKKLLYLLTAVITVVSAQAQWDYTPYLSTAASMRGTLQWSQKMRDSIVNNNIHEVVEYVKTYTKKGEMKRCVVVSHEVYNEHGDLTTAHYYTRKGKPWKSTVSTYEANGLLNNYTAYNGDGKFDYAYSYTFGTGGLLVQHSIFMHGKDKPTWREEYTFNADSNLTKMAQYDRRGKLAGTIEKDYYPDKKIKETRRYTRKGKLDWVVKYDCTPAGTMDGKKNDTSTRCSRSEYDADSIKTVTEEVSKNGKIWRHITRINKKNQMIEFAAIDHKGRIEYQSKYTYNAEGRVAESTSRYRRHKSAYTIKYEYSPTGQVISEKKYNHKGILTEERFTMIK